MAEVKANKFVRYEADVEEPWSGRAGASADWSGRSTPTSSSTTRPREEGSSSPRSRWVTTFCGQTAPSSDNSFWRSPRRHRSIG